MGRRTTGKQDADDGLDDSPHAEATGVRLAILTYDAPHLKTRQVLQRLRLDPDLQIVLYALPFQPRPLREIVFAHRPEMAVGPSAETLAADWKLPFTRVTSAEEIEPDFEAALVCGAGLLPASLVEHVPVINAHPGLIPAVRGLDAFLWAIHDDQPLGVSLHKLDADIDAGEHLKSRRTEIRRGDDIASVSARHYQNEIDLMIEFQKYLGKPENPLVGQSPRPARKRMPADLARETISRFPGYAEKFSWPG